MSTPPPENGATHRYRVEMITTGGDRPLRISDFLREDDPRAKCRVGVAFSGGGSRALVAGMGQLQGLRALGVIDQIKAISTVSGGSWLGVPWTYLDDTCTEDDFLGVYQSPAELTTDSIAKLPVGNIGGQTCNDFMATDIAWRMVDATMRHLNTPAMAWQCVIGEQFLQPYGLGDLDQGFTRDQATQAAIDERNPTAPVPVRTIAADRPFLLCNLGLVGFAADPRQADADTIADADADARSIRPRAVCPVQSTPCFTGAFGRPAMTGRLHAAIGGGGSESFGFNGLPARALKGREVQSVEVYRLWSLVDAAGTSSAFVAAAFVNIIQALVGHGLLRVFDEVDNVDKVDEAPDEVLQRALCEQIAGQLRTGALQLPDGLTLADIVALLIKIYRKYKLPGILSILTMEPRYHYHSPLAAPEFRGQLTTFVDGGDYDNTGVSALLAYDDIDTVVAFVNTETAVRRASGSASPDLEPRLDPSVDPDPDRDPVYGKYLISWDVAALFGYVLDDRGPDQRPGYFKYAPFAAAQHISIDANTLTHTQVFPHQDFPSLIDALGAAADRGGPVVYEQELQTCKNDYAGVAAGRTVKLLWCLLNPVQGWVDALAKDVRAAVEDEVARHAFPNVSTFLTQLTPQQVNLLANQTAWCVCAQTDANAPLRRLFGK